MEQTLEWTKGLQLRPDRLAPVNTPALVTCRNLRAHRGALRQFHDIDQPFSDTYISTTLSETKAWPWPQIFLGKRVSLLCFEQRIYTLTETSGNWTAAALVIKNAVDIEETSPANLALSTGGGPWQFMDFGDAWFLFNGKAVIFKFPPRNIVFGTEAVTIHSGTAWLDTRGVLCGFNVANFFALNDWRDFLSDYRHAPNDTAPQEVQNLADNFTQGPNHNWVWVTSTGGEELWFPFSESWMKYASLLGEPEMGYTDDNPFILELFARNEASFIPMPWQGRAVVAKPLGEGVVIYGETYNAKHGGVTGLRAAERLVGLRDISGLTPGIGIAGRGAVGGDESGHMFMDESGALWEIAPNFSARLVGGDGYREFFEDMTLADVVISYDHAHQEYHITDGDTAFVYNVDSGLSEAPVCPTSIHIAQGVVIGVTIEASESDAVTLVSHPFQLQSSSTGVLEFIEISGIDQNSAINVSVDYRFRRQDNWTTTAAIVTDGHGRAYFHQPGWQWRWRITHADRTALVIDGVYAHVSTTAKRRSAHWYAASTPGTAVLP